MSKAHTQCTRQALTRLRGLVTGIPPSQPLVQKTRAKKLALRAANLTIQQQIRRLGKNRLGLVHIRPIRLQKALAQSGAGSRRAMEEWIKAGLITINDKLATLGDKVNPYDRVCIKNAPIKLKWADRLPRVLIYHKQEGEIVTRHDPQGRITVFDRLTPTHSSRWVAIGRLDINTSGLLIMTTSGVLANRFMHPSFAVEREYAVRILGELSTETCQTLCHGIELDDGFAKLDSIVLQGGEGANRWYHVVIKEGRHREIRRLFTHFNVQVSRLIRIRFGQISLPPRLKRGQFYELNEIEVASLLKWAHLSLHGTSL